MKNTSLAHILNWSAIGLAILLQAQSAGVSFVTAIVALPWASFLTGLSSLFDASGSVRSTDLLVLWIVVSLGIGIVHRALFLRAREAEAVDAPSRQESPSVELAGRTVQDAQQPTMLASVSARLSPEMQDEIRRLEAALLALGQEPHSLRSDQKRD